MTLLEAQQTRVDFPAHPNTTLGAIAETDVSYLDYLASQSWVDFVTAEAVAILCDHHGRKPKRVVARTDGRQLGLGL